MPTTRGRCLRLQRVAAICIAGLASHSLHFEGSFAAVNKIPKKVDAGALAQHGEDFCNELKHRGFAIVGFDLTKRRDALDWLESLAGKEDLQLANCGLQPGQARHETVSFPRPLQRLDLIPSDAAIEDTGAAAAVHLARELHNLSVSCLMAVARHENMPELLDLVAETPEPLHAAKEPSFLRANIYAGQDSAGPCWHLDLGLLTVAPAGSWPALMASPFHEAVGETAFLEELLDPDRDVLVFAGTALAVATAGRYTGLVHGVSAGRLKQTGTRVSMPYFLRPRSGAVLHKPVFSDEGLAYLYPAAVQPAGGAAVQPTLNGMLDLLRFHRDLYGRLCTRGQVVPMSVFSKPELQEKVRHGFYL
ncbi:unnamed protein product [Symbiodinium pilosum]|uniref:Fe2OG dioxygenase domain-containing protein n=1 Tax=Symbiodinium pilosum TaxID=2952 RepID=A0A812KXB7_SYMPI|nr:unnamed protein product [Symbiodinium pilosum]